MRCWIALCVLVCSPVSASVPFIRGDVNANGAVAIDDAVFLLSHLFVSGSPAPSCRDAGDTDDNGYVNIADAVALLAYLFIPGSPTPAYPFPSCGTDPGQDTLTCLGPVPTCPFSTAWSVESPMGTAKGALCGAIFDGQLHAFGGATLWNGAGTDGLHQTYEFATGTWSTAAPVPDNATWGAEGVVASDGRFYLMGGWSGGELRARRYDASLDTWETLPDLPWPFEWGHVVAQTPGRVHVFGGRGAFHHVVFDIATDSWAFAAAPLTYSYGMAGETIGDRIYAVGTPSARLQVYDVLTDSWSYGPDLPAYTYAPATCVHDGKLIVVSGTTNETGGNVCTVQTFDPLTQLWSELDPIPTPRSWSLAVVWQDALHVVGGFALGNQATATHEMLSLP
ncbi:MAG: hypothetical protein KDC38_02570 [Planctomycetes bacterium]|nr:hypothetical protein [Planctomycetota bacterium]